VQKKMFKQKRFAGRHLLTFESQKLNYFGKKVGPHTSHGIVKKKRTTPTKEF
jgi:hypothetical protein